MVKKGYCRNESLSLAWDHIEVCHVALFNTAWGQVLKSSHQGKWWGQTTKELNPLICSNELLRNTLICAKPEDVNPYKSCRKCSCLF